QHSLSAAPRFPRIIREKADEIRRRLPLAVPHMSGGRDYETPRFGLNDAVVIDDKIVHLAGHTVDRFAPRLTFIRTRPHPHAAILQRILYGIEKGDATVGEPEQRDRHIILFPLTGKDRFVVL